MPYTQIGFAAFAVEVTNATVQPTIIATAHANEVIFNRPASLGPFLALCPTRYEVNECPERSSTPQTTRLPLSNTTVHRTCRLFLTGCELFCENAIVRLVFNADPSAARGMHE